MVSEHFFPETSLLLDALVERIAEQLRLAVEAHGQAVFLVSGGSSPKPVYERLSDMPLAWDKIIVVLVDERWVSLDHPASNAAFISQHLLKNNAENTRFIGLKNAAATAKEGQASCEKILQTLPAEPDVCLLGMGNDGHTASLFPYAQGLSAGLENQSPKRCVAICAQRSEVTGKFTERMSLNFSYLSKAKHSFLLINGEQKRQAYTAALQAGPIEDMPIRAFLQSSEVQLNVYWSP
ncbi:6-phosphogluconolactonase [Spongiibacter sp. KMU-158]|uniref:6-phosphogluconolactonase n=1 Tax=Spongiibacter pelagi TaxID=2760804 RepID=A0A927C2K4_9GAMM|nr:6-phosphogluconolactonase [Spongiibacter pelagi]MBD2859599.1 6-phosphogluconolactonase [Spongiibacter pelagi]